MPTFGQRKLQIYSIPVSVIPLSSVLPNGYRNYEMVRNDMRSEWFENSNRAQRGWFVIKRKTQFPNTRNTKDSSILGCYAVSTVNIVTPPFLTPLKTEALNAT
jgi:hypothetical protein